MCISTAGFLHKNRGFDDPRASPIKGRRLSIDGSTNQVLIRLEPCFHFCLCQSSGEIAGKILKVQRGSWLGLSTLVSSWRALNTFAAVLPGGKCPDFVSKR